MRMNNDNDNNLIVHIDPWIHVQCAQNQTIMIYRNLTLWILLNPLFFWYFLLTYQCLSTLSLSGADMSKWVHLLVIRGGGGVSGRQFGSLGV